jgi:hypothetical protein
MAPLLIRSKDGATFSQSNRGRDIGILVACVAAIALLLWLMSASPHPPSSILTAVQVQYANTHQIEAMWISCIPRE